MRLVSAFVLSALLAIPAAFAQQKPEEFSYRMQVVTDTTAPYYRLTVPVEVYQQSARGELEDLRIFNSAGQIVPYARLVASASSQESTRRVKLRWFPLMAEKESTTTDNAAVVTVNDSSLNVSVRQNSDGTLVEVHKREVRNSPAANPSPVPPPAVRGYILDVSQVVDRSHVYLLELDWSAGSNFQLIDIETSNDLRNWRPLRSSVQLARLQYGGEQIENRRIELNGFQDRYMRLMWREPDKAPLLTLAEIEQRTTSFESAPIIWSPQFVAMRMDVAGTGEYRFHLPQPLPVARLRIELPAGNILMPLAVIQPTTSGGRQPRPMLHQIGSGVVYRILDKGREWSLNEITLGGGRIQDFVVRIDSRTTQPDRLSLSYALEPAQVLFLASGNSPYTLCVGNDRANDSALSASTLIPGFGSSGLQIANASLKPVEPTAVASIQQVSAGPVVAASPSKATDWKKYILWGVIVTVVIFMMFMATQLLRQMKQDSGAEKDQENQS
ncbi:MAG: hypothetical protein H6R18_1490 [Proteobacteria bacterium]|nr:hypothetical protein [Pseudomonadota bacterium]